MAMRALRNAAHDVVPGLLPRHHRSVWPGLPAQAGMRPGDDSASGFFQGRPCRPRDPVAACTSRAAGARPARRRWPPSLR
jgi:hypothetical protein